MAKTKEEAKVEIEVEKGKKERSYEARLMFSDKAFSIDIPIRWAKFNTKEVDAEYPMVFRNSKGEEVRNKTWVEDKVVETGEDEKEGWLTCKPEMKTKMRKAWTTPDGETTKEYTAFQIVDGKENAVEKNKKSDEFKVLALKDIAEYEDWQPEETAGLYKVWAEKSLGVWSLGQFVKKYLITDNKFAVIKISTGTSYKEYYGLIKPVIKGTGFGLTMKISRVKIDWEKGDALMEFLKEKPAEEIAKTKPKVGLADL